MTNTQSRSRLILFPALALCALTAGSARGADLCPPVPVTQGDVCECDVHNYGAKADTNVVIKLYSHTGLVETCGPRTISPGRGEFCFAQLQSNDVCGCAVTGESGDTRVSLSVVPALGQSPETTVACK